MRDTAIACEQVAWNEQGLVAAIAQDVVTKEILMMAWMNATALEETLKTGVAVYWSRSRQRLWRKGESSGQVQQVRGLYLDCDGDAILLQVEQLGVACHTGRRSCFYRAWQDSEWQVVSPVLIDPKTLYGA